MEATSTPQDEHAGITQKAALAGMALFLVTGLDLILGEIPHEWADSTWIHVTRYVLFLGTLFVPAISFGIGWIKSFPRWSYPYIGLELALLTLILSANLLASSLDK